MEREADLADGTADALAKAASRAEANGESDRAEAMWFTCRRSGCEDCWTELERLRPVKEELSSRADGQPRLHAIGTACRGALRRRSLGGLRATLDHFGLDRQAPVPGQNGAACWSGASTGLLVAVRSADLGNDVG
jgi:hypothetical protein